MSPVRSFKFFIKSKKPGKKQMSSISKFLLKKFLKKLVTISPTDRSSYSSNHGQEKTHVKLSF